jgi:hypothetical protein
MQDFTSTTMLEKFLTQIPDVTAIQIGTGGSNFVLYLD